MDIRGSKTEQMSSNSGVSAREIDQGLRAFMLQVYNYMGSALLLTGISAYMAFSFAVAEMNAEGILLTAFGNAIFNSPLKWVLMLAPLAFVFVLGMRLEKMSFKAAQMTFWAFSVLMGVSMSYIFLVFTGASIVRVFFITSAVFGAMSLYGYTTKRDLTGMGSFLMMGLFGIIIASIVNIFMQSSMMQFAISIIGVGIFVGLTAYDTQKLKKMYYSMAGMGEALGKAAIMGALSLYLDFINLFMMLLRLLGDRR